LAKNQKKQNRNSLALYSFKNKRRMKLNKLSILVLAFLLISNSNIFGEIVLPKIIGHNMVLQRQKAVPIWGTAAKGEKVTVAFGSQLKETVADDSGKWQVKLDPMEASDVPRELIITGTKVIKLQNILVGEVWLCSGQSNMEYTMMKNSKHQLNVKGTKPTEDDLLTAKNPAIRIFLVRRKYMSPDPDHNGWEIAADSALRTFSAVGYFYAKELYRKLHIPIGMISSAVPGSLVEPWIEAEKMDVSPKMKDGKVLEPLSADGRDPGKFYTTMIEPLIPFALRGFIWYQGESNCFLNETIRYSYKFKTLIESWRSNWKDEKMPFYFVQIAPYNYSASKDDRPHTTQSLPEFWEAQTLALLIPHTGMIVTTDLVDSIVDIHPSYKWEVGRRLSLMALNETYGFKDLICTGPIYKKMKIVRNQIEVGFTGTDGGLTSRDGKPLDWFTVAGADGQFVPALAVIRGDKVIVSSPRVKHPVFVRFAWHESAQSNFINKAGLPAAPFRSDNPWINKF